MALTIDFNAPHYFSSDLEEKVLHTRKEVGEYADFHAEHDVWLTPEIRECQLLGFTSLDAEAEKKRHKLSDEDTDAVLSSPTHFALWVNSLFASHVLPIREIAMEDVWRRAEMLCPSMTRDDDRKEITAIPPQRRAAIASETMTYHANKMQVLFRDGAISGAKSDQYQIFREKDIIASLEKELKDLYPDAEFVEGTVSHTRMALQYKLNADAEEFAFADKLMQLMPSLGNIKAEAYVWLISSDVGDNAVTAVSEININGQAMRLGKRIALRHDKGNTLGMFEKMLAEDLGKVLREAEDQVEMLGNLTLKNPNEVLYALCDKNGIAKSKYSGAMVSGDTAMDVYFSAAEISSSTATDSLQKQVEIQDKLASILFRPSLFKELDEKANI